MWDAQRAFSRLHYDVGEMDEDVREAKTRELALALHHEVSKLVSAVNFRGHIPKQSSPDRDKVLYEAVDAVRYAMAIANLWDFDDDDFVSAWWDKDSYLNEQHRLEHAEWDGRPVVVWDIDDVLADFRAGFARWLHDKHGIEVDHESPEYFFIEELAQVDRSSLDFYDEFIADREVAKLPVTDAVDVANRIRSEEGTWTHIITARPSHNLICRYDTYHWLRTTGLEYDALSFTGEKLAYVSRTPYTIDRRVAACVDDGPNHCASYIAHGYHTLMPAKSYNRNVRPDELLWEYRGADELYDALIGLVRRY